MNSAARDWTADEREEADLASLVASRLCHDLVSPIGAIGNGVELLGMTGVAGPEMDLIGESVEGANARIRIYRVAFGAAPDDQVVDARQIGAMLESPHRGSKATVDWRVAGTLPRGEAKLAVLLLMCLETAMVQGGEVSAGRHGTAWRIDGRGPGLRAEPETWSHLTGAASTGLTSALVQFPLAALTARRMGRRLDVDMSPERIELRF